MPSYAWIVLLGRHGVINEALLALGMIATPLRLPTRGLQCTHDDPHPAALHDTPIASSLRQIDLGLPRAAAGLGASPCRACLQVPLLSSMPGVAAGTLLVFVRSLGFYITPALVGGPHDLMRLMPRRMWDDLRFAIDATIAALSTLTIVLTALLLAALQFVCQPGQCVAVSRRSD